MNALETGIIENDTFSNINLKIVSIYSLILTININIKNPNNYIFNISLERTSITIYSSFDLIVKIEIK